MDPLHAAASSSDESSFGSSTAPTSPEWSPLLPAQTTRSDLEDRLRRLNYASSSRGSEGNISDILGPAALSGNNSAVSNVCVIGAGYVGKTCSRYVETVMADSQQEGRRQLSLHFTTPT
jgi:hypothetical protein